MTNNDDGFTVVELLIVLLILCLLTIVVVFAVGRITADDAANACSIDLQEVEDAVDDYYADRQVLPTSMADLEGYLRHDSDRAGWAIADGGTVVPVSGSDCTSGDL